MIGRRQSPSHSQMKGTEHASQESNMPPTVRNDAQISIFPHFFIVSVPGGGIWGKGARWRGVPEPCRNVREPEVPSPWVGWGVIAANGSSPGPRTGSFVPPFVSIRREVHDLLKSEMRRPAPIDWRTQAIRIEIESRRPSLAESRGLISCQFRSRHRSRMRPFGARASTCSRNLVDA